MASLTVRNLDDNVKKRLRKQAAENGRSLEAEVRDILGRASHQTQPERPKNGLDFFKPIRDVVEKYGGVELDLPERTPVRRIDVWPEDDTPSTGGMGEAEAPFRRAPGKSSRRRSKR
jgi:plasmid stability protein